MFTHNYSKYIQAANLLMAAVILAGLASCGNGKSTTETGEIPEIAVAPVITDSITIYKTYPGTVTASSSVDLVPRASGNLVKVYFKGGDFVRKGQVLFSIEDTQYRNAVQQASAQLATAQSNLEYARTHYEAMAKALLSDAVAQIEVAQAKNALQECEAAVNNAKAQLETARTNLSYCTITAPIDGHITSSSPSAGSYLSAGSGEVLATIYEDSSMNANFFIEDAAVLRMFNNQNGRDKIDYTAIPVAFADTLPHKYTGNLTYMSPNVDESTGTLKLQAKVNNPYGELRNGMYASISLPYKFDPEAMLVKDAAIGSNQLGKYLYIVNDSDEVIYTPITVGDLYADTLRVVTSGIKPGQRYVTKALLKVRDGMKVKPVNE
ncbi:MAG: efflux RND transporter periplasmic adaptor subunit [Muribaculaceae bacterium]|nr:efflux RND transporter periplasmic adaptor subunit [Muribaculaceae bacterium]